MFLALLALCIWVYLFAAHGRFWASDPALRPAVPSLAADVDIIVPARDEAATIASVVASLLSQQYAGRFRITLVDDNSSDDTAALAGQAENLAVLRLTEKPAGWSGKLYALAQGVKATNAPLILFTDADIVHDPRHLASLVSKLESGDLGMMSEMVRLNCRSFAERALIPAFVYFFQMLYPFRLVNDPRSRTAAAAGGTVLISRGVLDRIGGIESIKDALIDDVTLAQAVKKTAPVYLGHSDLARSIRPYPRFRDIWNMIARTAFTQLRYSSLLLMGTLLGLLLVWWVPVGAALFGNDVARGCGLAACVLAFISFLPTLRRYRLSPTWGLALPLIALFYMAATLASAVNHWRGSGASWKRRYYDS
ncbi:MAG TPA: glycosyltransferase [Steroidobacteraceae bacterium]|jgi:hopene-associated glycosyltransferase HpnB